MGRVPTSSVASTSIARVLVTSVAYLGDVAPFVAPANELANRGHDVTFLTPVGFHDVLRGEKFKLAAYPLDFSARRMHADPEHQKLMRHPIRNQMRLVRYWTRVSWSDDPDAAGAALLDAVKGADVVVSHPTFCGVVSSATRHLGVPLVAGHLFPMMIPTASWTPPLGKRSPNLGRVVNRAVWAALRSGSGRLLHDRQLNEFRRSLGLPKRRGNTGFGWEDADRVVVLASRHYYGEGPSDWPPLTWGGFSHWAGPVGQEVDPAIDAFIGAGDSPVLVTLGTSAATGAADAFATMAAGLDRVGLRALLLVGQPDNLVAVRGRGGAFVFAPLAPILPRCRVAVVSGALGTLAAALAAGLPVVVVPQLFDQFWHGGQVERLGVGKMVLRAKDVAKAVAEIDADPSYRHRAQSLAAAMSTENAAEVLADETESLL